jgi:hypothetical protein
MGRARQLTASVLLGAVLAACAGDRSSDPEQPATNPAAAGGTAVPVALDFDAPLVGGGRFDARTFAGRPLALWFWAPY